MRKDSWTTSPLKPGLTTSLVLKLNYEQRCSCFRKLRTSRQGIKCRLTAFPELGSGFKKDLRLGDAGCSIEAYPASSILWFEEERAFPLPLRKDTTGASSTQAFFIPPLDYGGLSRKELCNLWSCHLGLRIKQRSHFPSSPPPVFFTAKCAEISQSTQRSSRTDATRGCTSSPAS